MLLNSIFKKILFPSILIVACLCFMFTSILASSSGEKVYINDFFKVSTQDYQNWLTNNADDYIGTRYSGVTSDSKLGYDYWKANTPISDTTRYSYGYGFNCAGFVLRTFWDAYTNGAIPSDAAEYSAYFNSLGMNYSTGGVDYSGNPSPGHLGIDYNSFLTFGAAKINSQLVSYYYSSYDDMMSGLKQLVEEGIVEDGTIIMSITPIAGEDEYGNTRDNHIGIYWNPDEVEVTNEAQIYWNSTHTTNGLGSTVVLDGNQISNVTGKSAGVGWYIFPLAPSKGELSLVKSSSNTDITNDNDCYSLEDAVYGVYSSYSEAESALGNGTATGSEVATLTTDASGNTDTVSLKAGTYYVAEISASMGYAIDTTIHTISVSAGEETEVFLKETPLNDPIGITITKTAKGDLNGDNDVASLEGAQFTIKYYDGYYDENNLPATATRTWVIEVKQSSDGAYQSLLTDTYLVSELSDPLYYMDGVPVLPIGTITIEETKAAEGYKLEGSTLTFLSSGEVKEGTFLLSQVSGSNDIATVQAGNEYMVSNVEIRGGFIINKIDYETSFAKAQGAATLEGAEITLYNESNFSVNVDGVEYAPGEEIANFETDEDGYIETAEDYLSYGIYKLVETKAPDGYLIEGKTETIFSINEEGIIVDLTNSEASISDRIKRGDVELVKVADTTDSSNMTRLANVAFRISSLTTGESHIIVTDINGQASTASSWNPHSQNTNRGETSKDGIWFNGYNDEENGAQADDALGALPYDDYLLEELPGESNAGYELISLTFSVYRDKVSINLGTLDNHAEETEIAEIEDLEDPLEETPEIITTYTSSEPQTGDTSGLLAFVLMLAIGGGSSVLLYRLYKRKRRF